MKENNWFDPFYIQSHLNEEESNIQKNVRDFCNNELKPTVVERNRKNEFDKELYPSLKKQCDDYFYLPHRQEARGIGGLFFDDWNEPDFETAFALMRSVGDSYLEAYLPILERRRHTPFGERQRNFQLHRRGRYAEFNLVFDRGTQFGLQTGGRAESILMSLPPKVCWSYNYQVAEDSEEAVLQRDFLPTRDWLGDST